ERRKSDQPKCCYDEGEFAALLRDAATGFRMNAIESLRIPALLDPMPEPLRILFADDHEIFCAGLRQVLAADRHIEIIAELADGETALRDIRALKPHVAVLDFDLPGRDGLDIV